MNIDKAKAHSASHLLFGLIIYLVTINVSNQCPDFGLLRRNIQRNHSCAAQDTLNGTYRMNKEALRVKLDVGNT